MSLRVIKTMPLTLKGLIYFNPNARIKCAICGFRSNTYSEISSLPYFKLKDRNCALFTNKLDDRKLCYCANCADEIEFLDAKYYTCQLSKEDITIF